MTTPTPLPDYTCPACGQRIHGGAQHVCAFNTPTDPLDIHDATVLYRTDAGVFVRVEPHAVLLPGDKLYTRKKK